LTFAGSVAGAVAERHALPGTGIAVQTDRGVVLVDVGGHVRRFLSGFSLRVGAVERQGQVEVRDRAGKAYELRAGALVRVPPGSIMLRGGYVLRFSSHWTLLRGTRVVERIRPWTFPALDSSGSVLSLVPLPGHVEAAPVTVAHATCFQAGCSRSLGLRLRPG
jgi:hypothetical protein